MMDLFIYIVLALMAVATVAAAFCFYKAYTYAKASRWYAECVRTGVYSGTRNKPWYIRKVEKWGINDGI